MHLQSLNRQYGIPSQLEFVAGRGGLPMIRVRNPAAAAEISLYGGQLLSYRPAGQEHDLLFLSRRAHFAVGKAIKGGIPVCWPWFGADPLERGRPAHGFARTRLWSVEQTQRVAEDVTRITLLLREDAETLALWPHAFELRLVVSIGAGLDLELLSYNTGPQPVTLTQALHSYFAVGDVRRARVVGLDGADYLDKVRGFARGRQSGPVTFEREVDRIYLQTRGSQRIDDPTWCRGIGIAARGSATTVVWNPWQEISAAMVDLDDDDYRRFICVETANAADEVITLAPGADHRLAASLRIAPAPLSH